MAARFQKSWRAALSLTVAVTAMALGGSAGAQTVNEIRGGKVNIRCEGPTDNCLNPAGGSLRNAPEGAPADEPVTDAGHAPSVPAPSTPGPSATSADEPPADADAPAEDPSEDAPDVRPNDDA